MSLHVLSDEHSLILPRSHRAVRAKEQHSEAADDQADQGDNEGNPPRLGRGHALMSD